MLNFNGRLQYIRKVKLLLGILPFVLRFFLSYRKSGQHQNMEVKDLISKWRTRSADLKTFNAKLDKIRDTFNALDSEKSVGETEIEAQKLAMKSSIDEVMAEVEGLKSKRKNLQEENKKHLAKVQDRVEKNKHHKNVLDERRAVLTTQQTKLDTAESGIRSRLAAFRDERTRVQQQLRHHIQQAKEALPKERAEFEKQLETLRKKIAAVQMKRNEEEKAWEQELARRRKAARAAAHKALVNEAAIAQEERSSWSALARSAPPSVTEEISGAVASLRARLQVA